MSEAAIELLRRCDEAASRVNPESRHRVLLRKTLRWYDLEILAALLLLDTVSRWPEQYGVTSATPLVREIRAVLQPFYESPAQPRGLGDGRL